MSASSARLSQDQVFEKFFKNIKTAEDQKLATFEAKKNDIDPELIRQWLSDKSSSTSPTLSETSHKKNTKRPIILFNNVYIDGIGDFFHLVDIYLALSRNPKMKNYQIIPVIAYGADWQYERIKKTLEEMGVSHYYMEKTNDFSKKYRDDETFIKDIESAYKFILVSFPLFPAIEIWRKWNPRAQFRYIGEHESILDTSSRSLGLSEGCYGLKFNKLARIKPDEATALIEKENKRFSELLLEKTESKNFSNFHKLHLLIPAYFNHMLGLDRFINFLAKGNLQEDKNIVLFLSGKDLAGFGQSFGERFCDGAIVKKLDETSTVKQVTIIEAGVTAPISLDVNSKGTRNIFIFYGYHLSTTAYQALYQQTLLAGVSGDNTLELALGLTLPYYESTNHFNKNKYKTTKAIAGIIDKLDLPTKVKQDFSLYFSMKMNDSDEVAAVAKKIDLNAMIEAWPIVANFLVKHHNFYDQLEDIIFERYFKTKCNFFSQIVPEKVKEIVSSPSSIKPICSIL